jgi:hypothetical protein
VGNEARFIDFLKAEAIKRGLLEVEADVDAARVFTLVRDMPYRRASNRNPRTTIAEWQGTCSGKHYLLQALFAELGLTSQVMACTTITPVAPEEVPASHRSLYQAANQRFVDIHNYLWVTLPDGRGHMIVDATWPLSARSAGLVSNEAFILGEDQQLAAEPLETWPIPQGIDPQEFKEQLLKSHFSEAELEFREEVIRALGEKTSQSW